MQFNLDNLVDELQKITDLLTEHKDHLSVTEIRMLGLIISLGILCNELVEKSQTKYN